MLLFINTFCKINFGSIHPSTELGQQATNGGKRNKEAPAQSIVDFTKQYD